MNKSKCSMKKGIKYIQMMWRAKESRGPDVEMILYIPIVVAIESKLTADAALREIGQVIKYVGSGLYDAMIVRIVDPVDTNAEEWKYLAEMADRYGIGIISGGEPYAPLGGRENVLVKAKLRLGGNPIRVYEKGRRMDAIFIDFEDSGDLLRDASYFRKYFCFSRWGGER